MTTMSSEEEREEQEELTNQEGPLFRAMGRRAQEIDKAETTAERRWAWARFLPSVAVAFLEDAVRRWLAIGALLLSVVVVLAGLTADESGWAVAGVIAGVLGAVAVLAALIFWSFGRQLVVYAAVIALHAALLFAYGQAT